MTHPKVETAFYANLANGFVILLLTSMALLGAFQLPSWLPTQSSWSSCSISETVVYASSRFLQLNLTLDGFEILPFWCAERISGFQSSILRRRGGSFARLSEDPKMPSVSEEGINQSINQSEKETKMTPIIKGQDKIYV
jgi:hypothetical protein